MGEDGWTGDLTDGRQDGKTDMTKPIISFRNFANAPKHRNHFTDIVFDGDKNM
jgi:hypothetical protein